MNDNTHPGLAALKRLMPDIQLRLTVLAHLLSEKKRLRGFLNEGDVDTIMRLYLGTIPNGVCVPIREWLETL